MIVPMSEDYIIQEVDTFDLVAALGSDFSCDAFCWLMDGDDMIDPGDLLTSKIEDMFGNTADEYLIEAMEQGMQRDPIVVGVNGWTEYGEGYDWTLGNGNHRLAVAVALMLPTILVVFQEDKDDYMLEEVSECW